MTKKQWIVAIVAVTLYVVVAVALDHKFEPTVVSTRGEVKFVEYPSGLVCAYVGEVKEENVVVCGDKAMMLETFSYLDADASDKKR
jgi:hypothetical protein